MRGLELLKKKEENVLLPPMNLAYESRKLLRKASLFEHAEYL